MSIIDEALDEELYKLREEHRKTVLQIINDIRRLRNLFDLLCMGEILEEDFLDSLRDLEEKYLGRLSEI